MVQSWGAKVHEARLPGDMTSSKTGCHLSVGPSSIFLVL